MKNGAYEIVQNGSVLNFLCRGIGQLYLQSKIFPA